jgi:dCTP deaminase
MDHEHLSSFPHSLLSDREILKAKKLGNIVITPYRKSHLKTSSYDVSLGEWFYRQQRHDLPYYIPWNESHVRQIWGEPQQAQKAETILGTKLPLGIKAGDRVIVLHPRELILAHTIEFIGGKNGITTMMKARSSMGRNGISVCKCAGWGDVGYINRWTMEIENSLSYPVVLPVGARVAQITFFPVGETLQETYDKDGKYQTEEKLEKLVKTWKPEAMLPKLWKDIR